MQERGVGGGEHTRKRGGGACMTPSNPHPLLTVNRERPPKPRVCVHHRQDNKHTLQQTTHTIDYTPDQLRLEYQYPQLLACAKKKKVGCFSYGEKKEKMRG